MQKKIGLTGIYRELILFSARQETNVTTELGLGSKYTTRKMRFKRTVFNNKVQRKISPEGKTTMKKKRLDKGSNNTRLWRRQDKASK